MKFESLLCVDADMTLNKQAKILPEAIVEYWRQERFQIYMIPGVV